MIEKRFSGDSRVSLGARHLPSSKTPVLGTWQSKASYQEPRSPSWRKNVENDIDGAPSNTVSHTTALRSSPSEPFLMT